MSSEMPPLPLLAEMNAPNGLLSRAWAEFFIRLRTRIGGDIELTNAELAALPGRVVQDVFTQSGAVATGTTTIPYDDTPPQSAEGTEFLTRVITPAAAANRLVIEAVLYFSSSAAARHMIAALFQDASLSAIAASSEYIDAAGGSAMLVLRHEMAAGTLSPTTFKIRVGTDAAATITMNGIGGVRLFGGVTVSSLRVTERMP